MTTLSRRGPCTAGPLLALSGWMLAGAAMADVTGIAGGNMPFPNVQPSLAVTQVLPLSGLYPLGTGEPLGGTLGFVYSFAGTFAPRDSAAADGRVLNISSNSAVFSLLGTTYGGDGMRTFALPDLRGRAIVGEGSGPGLRGRTLGERFGTSDVLLLPSQLPVHRHTLLGGGQTDVAGGNSPFDNTQPSLTMTRVIALNGPYPSISQFAQPVFTGQVGTFAGYSVPSGWAVAAGQLLPISQYASLFSLIGTRYGGNGITTFALPDLRGRVSVGATSGSPVGTAFGAEDITLQASQMPRHAHGLGSGGSTAPAGDHEPVNNLQPSLALTPLIALQGLYPTPDNSRFNDDAPLIGQIVEFAGTFAPDGWAIADGQLLSIAANPALYSVIGNIYGGDGVSTFALPDLRGRTMVGSGQSMALGRTLYTGEQLGISSVNLSQSNLPMHLHSLPPVPEPGTWALLLAGLAGLGLARARQPA